MYIYGNKWHCNGCVLRILGQGIYMVCNVFVEGLIWHRIHDRRYDNQCADGCIMIPYVNINNQVVEKGFGAICNIALDATNKVVLKDHIGSLVSMLEYRRERPEVSNAWVSKYVW